VLVDLRQVLLQPGDQLRLGLDPEMSKKPLTEFGQEAFDAMQPRALCGREDACEAIGARGQMRLGFPRGMRRVVVEYDLNLRGRVVLGIQGLEKLHELAAPVAVAEQPDSRPRRQINPRQQADRAMADVLGVPFPGSSRPLWLGRPIRGRRPDRRDAGCLVNGTGSALIGSSQKAEHVLLCAAPGQEEADAAALVPAILRRRGEADPEAVLWAIAERVRERRF
jgi:hypothetical protein